MSLANNSKDGCTNSGFIDNEKTFNSANHKNIELPVYLINPENVEKTKDTVKPGSKDDPYRVYRISKQACIIAIWIGIGLYGGIIGPTLPDLRDSIGVDMDGISSALVSKTVGILMGSLAGGFLFNIFYKKADFLLFLGVVGMATIAIAPHGDTLPFVCFFYGTAGFGEGIVNVGGNPMVMHLWQEYAATPLMLTHFGYGVGAIISPQIAKSFLSANIDEVLGNITTMSPAENSANNKDNRHWYMFSQYRWEYESGSYSNNNEESRITVCYGIVGILILCIGLCQFYFVVTGAPPGYKKWKPEAPLIEMVSPGSCAQGNVAFGLELLICLFIFYGVMSGGQAAYTDYLYSYATESDLAFSTEEATAINSTFFFCYTMGRLFGGIVAKCVPVQAILATALGFTCVELVILAIFAEQNEVVFWTCTCMFGFTCTMLFPSGMAWSNTYLHMNSMSVMVLMIGSSVGRIPFQKAAGYLYDKYDPNYIFYVSCTGYFSLVLVFIIMQLIASCNRNVANAEAANEDLVITVTDEKINSNILTVTSNGNTIKNTATGDHCTRDENFTTYL